MTTVQYSKQADAFRVVNLARITTLPRNAFFALFTDQDLLDCAAQAIECAGEPIAVPSTSFARGLKPRNAQVHGLAQ